MTIYFDDFVFREYTANNLFGLKFIANPVNYSFYNQCNGGRLFSRNAFWVENTEYQDLLFYFETNGYSDAPRIDMINTEAYFTFPLRAVQAE